MKRACLAKAQIRMNIVMRVPSGLLKINLVQMKSLRSLIILTMTAIIAVACTQSKESLLKNIKEKEKIIKENKTEIYDNSTAESLRKDYQNFIKRFPEDTLAPYFLHRSAEVALGMNLSEESVKDLDTLIKKYPGYKFLPEAFFFKGFIQENHQKNLDAARQTYSRFLITFPNHPLYDQVKLTLDNLGKSPDEIIKGFMDKNQENDSLAMKDSTKEVRTTSPVKQGKK